MIGEGWTNSLYHSVLNTDAMLRALLTLDELYGGKIPGNRMFPTKGNIFKAFRDCPRDKVKVIFLGQDPYKNFNATGLAFANPAGTPLSKLSPSLGIIVDAFERCYPGEGNHLDVTLEQWAKQGVLLLNSSLTSSAPEEMDFYALWRPLIHQVIKSVTANGEALVLLFGAEAKRFTHSVDPRAKSVPMPHPAYCARYNTKLHLDFIGINKYLISLYGKGIDWVNPFF